MSIIDIGRGLFVVDGEYLKNLQIAATQKGKRVEALNAIKAGTTQALQDQIGGKPIKYIKISNKGKVK